MREDRRVCPSSGATSCNSIFELRHTLAPTRSDGDLLAPPEDPGTLDDGIVYFGLEHLEEAVFAYLLACLWPFDERSSGVTE